MIELLFLLIFWEALMILILLFDTSFKNLLILTLDRLNRDRWPLILKSAAATLLALLLSGLYGNADDHAHHLSPTDHLLQTTLIGVVLFLAVMIERLHHYMTELRNIRECIAAMKNLEATKALEEERDKLKVKLVQLNSDFNSKAKHVAVAVANITALKKQSQGFLLENHRALDENHNLRKKLRVLDRRLLSRSLSKKNM